MCQDRLAIADRWGCVGACRRWDVQQALDRVAGLAQRMWMPLDTQVLRDNYHRLVDSKSTASTGWLGASPLTALHATLRTVRLQPEGEVVAGSDGSAFTRGARCPVSEPHARHAADCRHDAGTPVCAGGLKSAPVWVQLVAQALAEAPHGVRGTLRTGYACSR